MCVSAKTSLNWGKSESRTHCKELILEKEIPSSESTIILFNYFVTLGRDEKSVSKLKWQGVKGAVEGDFQRIVHGFELGCSNHVF